MPTEPARCLPMTEGNRCATASRQTALPSSDRTMEALFVSMQLHIGYLRSLEDSERVRSACVKYLQTCLPSFYPERLDIVKQAEQIAATLGGRLNVPPPLSWKYAWIQKGFGWPLTKRAQMFLPLCKQSMIRSWDKVLSSFS